MARNPRSGRSRSRTTRAGSLPASSTPIETQSPRDPTGVYDVEGRRALEIARVNTRPLMDIVHTTEHRVRNKQRPNADNMRLRNDRTQLAPVPSDVKIGTLDGRRDEMAAQGALDSERRMKCKRRPKHNKGNGTGRAFVPWCK